MQGHIKVPGESVMVYAWTAISPFVKGWPECPSWHLCSEQLFLLSWPDACTDFPTKTNHDIVGASCGDVMMRWGILDDNIYISIERV